MHNKLLFVGLVFVFLSNSARATIVYDSLSGDTVVSDPLSRSIQQIPVVSLGDEITLAGTERIVTEIQVRIYSHYQFSCEMKISILENDGPLGEPQTEIWNTSIPFQLSSQSIYVVSFTVPHIRFPDSFTWLLSTRPTIPNLYLEGTAAPLIGEFPDYGWLDGIIEGFHKRNPLSGDPPIPINYCARIIAVPEPASLLLLGMSFLAVRSRKRKTWNNLF